MDRELASPVDRNTADIPSESTQCNEDVRIRKRKRECVLESLEWVKNVARDPYNPVIGCLPDRSKWNNFGEDQQWRQVLLFRQDTRVKLNAANSRAQQSILQTKRAKWFSHMYDDRRQSSRCTVSLAGLWFKESPGTKISFGIEYQAEIPDWSGNAYESDTKWLGTRVWPLEASQDNCVTRVPTEFGRPDQCGCESRGSYECVRFHVSEERKRLKLELGMSFYRWQIDKMGGEVASSWTRAEETTFEAIIIRSKPPSAEVSRTGSPLRKSAVMTMSDDLKFPE